VVVNLATGSAVGCTGGHLREDNRGARVGALTTFAQALEHTPVIETRPPLRHLPGASAGAPAMPAVVPRRALAGGIGRSRCPNRHRQHRRRRCGPPVVGVTGGSVTTARR
jgi:hypothetical protein